MYKDVISKVLESGQAILIPCQKDKRKQESTRVMLFHVRRRLPEILQQEIGIANFQFGEERYVKVYKRRNLELFTLDDKGVPIKLKERLIDQPANARQVELMRADGYSDEEIEEALEGGAND